MLPSRSILAAALAVGATLSCSNAASPERAGVAAAAELRATLGAITTEGALCPPASVATAVSEDGATVTVLFSEPVAGVQAASCRVRLEVDVPAGLSIGVPSSVIHGFASGAGGATVAHTYGFDGVSGSLQLSDSVSENFLLVARAAAPRSPSCEGARRVTYAVDIVASLPTEETFFQLDDLNVDTSFRFGTSWASCDAGAPLRVAPSGRGEFCDGPSGQPCAEGLACDRERAPQQAEGVCLLP